MIRISLLHACCETDGDREKATDGAEDLVRFNPLICKQDYRLKGTALLPFTPRQISIQRVFQNHNSTAVCLKDTTYAVIITEEYCTAEK